MKQTLQLKLGQQLKMTPQLQQAIRLLQLSTLDLQQEIQEALESNPMLELAEDSEDSFSNSGDDSFSTESYSARGSEEPGAPEPQASEEPSGEDELAPADTWSETIPEELPVDTQWDDIFQGGSSASGQGGGDVSEFEHKNTAQETLQDTLYWQLNLTPMVDSDRALAMAIIDAVQPNGLLSASPREIFEGIAEDLDVEFEDFEAVRHLIQQFEPVGVASEDLRECLLVQLDLLPPKTPFLNDARLIVDRYLPLLGSHDYAQLRKKTKFKEGRLRESINLILSLSPHPGDSVDDGNTEYIVPDVYVKKDQDRWLVELNSECAVRLRINNQYASYIKRADNSSDNNYLKNSLQEARWFINSLENRNETLMKVAGKIVEHQRGFLEYGEQAMKPLVLSDIAADIGMHESTISRVTTRKYMHTPRGIFELKYFFSSHVSTESGGECSSTAIRAIIKKYIAEESPRKPLSDSKIAEMLCKEGINVARRTVAKYRESMLIAPSNERKRLV